MPPIKPGRWTVNPADIDPRWLWFWQHAGHAAIYNEGSGPPYDFAQGGKLASTFTSVDWVPTPLGVGTQRGTTSDRLIWAAREGFQLFGDVAFSVGIVLDKTTNAGGLIVARDSTDNGMWELLHTSSTAVSFSWRVGGGGQTVSWTVASVSNGIHSFFVTRQVGGTYELWIDGVSQGIQTNATAPATSRAHDLEIGRRGANTDSVLGIYLVTYVWQGLALNDALVRQLELDPFGPFRRHEQISPDVGLTVTLVPISDGTITDVVNELDATSPLWSSIDEGVDTHDASDWVNNAIRPGTVQFFTGLGILPGPFQKATAATFKMQFRGAYHRSGSLTAYCRLYKADETTVLSDEVAGPTVSANTDFAATADITFTGLDTVADYTDWVDAKVRVRWA